jgi:murein DD-endopeptidase MepM/ murein hydrolase activator NlpD
MTYLLPAHGMITARWADMRPLSVPPAERIHVHGALDIAAGVGEPIVAPAAGTCYRFCIVRAQDGPGWAWPLREGQRSVLPWQDYPYDTYGGITVLDTHDGWVHLFAHSYMRQLQKVTRGLIWSYQEQPSDTRWPTMIWHTFAWGQQVEVGEPIAEVGSAGFSTGPHLHWELHRGWTQTPHEKRPDPEALL